VVKVFHIFAIILYCLPCQAESDTTLHFEFRIETELGTKELLVGKEWVNLTFSLHEEPLFGYHFLVVDMSRNLSGSVYSHIDFNGEVNIPGLILIGSTNPLPDSNFHGFINSASVLFAFEAPNPMPTSVEMTVRLDSNSESFHQVLKEQEYTCSSNLEYIELAGVNRLRCQNPSRDWSIYTDLNDSQCLGQKFSSAFCEYNERSKGI